MPLTTGKNGSFTYTSDNPKLSGTLSVSVKRGHHCVRCLDPYGKLYRTFELLPNSTIIIKVSSEKPMTLIQQYLANHRGNESTSGANSLALIEDDLIFQDAIFNSTYEISKFYLTSLVPGYTQGQYDRICFFANDSLLISQQPMPGYLEEINNETVGRKPAPAKKEPFLTPLHWAAFMGNKAAFSYLVKRCDQSSPFDALNDFQQFETFDLNPIDIVYALHPKDIGMSEVCSQSHVYNGHVVKGIQQHTPNTDVNSARSTRYAQTEKMCLCVVS